MGGGSGEKMGLKDRGAGNGLPLLFAYLVLFAQSLAASPGRVRKGRLATLSKVGNLQVAASYITSQISLTYNCKRLIIISPLFFSC